MKKFSWKLKSKKTIVLAFLIFLFLFLSFTRTGQVAYKTLLVLSREIPNNPLKPISLLTKTPKKEIITIRDGERSIKVALIKPEGPKTFPLAIVGPGAGLGIAQESLDTLVDSLARVGVGVVIPDIPEMENLGKGNYDPLNRSEDSLVNVFQYFSTQSYVNKNKMGFMGFCVGATLALAAAERESINNKVNFVIADQPFYGTSMLSLFGNKSLDPKGQIKQFLAQPITVKVVRDIYIEPLESENDKVVLRSIFENRISDIISQVNLLTPDGKSVFYLLSNGDPKKINDLLAALPKSVREKAISGAPVTGIKNLKAKVFNLSNIQDSYIPATESDYLVQALPKDQIYSLQVSSLNHLELDQHFKIFQDLGLYYQLYRFIFNTLDGVQP